MLGVYREIRWEWHNLAFLGRSGQMGLAYLELRAVIWSRNGRIIAKRRVLILQRFRIQHFSRSNSTQSFESQVVLQCALGTAF